MKLWNGFLSVSKVVTLVTKIFTMATMVNSQSCSRVETFNTGLTTAVSETRSRLPRVIDALKKSTSDFVCLQEVWQEKDMTAIVNALSDKFPNHYSSLHLTKNDIRPDDPKRKWYQLSQKKETACTFTETFYVSARVMMCGLFNSCFPSSGWEMGQCLTQKCSHLLKKEFIRPSCISCIFLNAQNSITDAISTCSISQKQHNRWNSPGLLVLSKHDLGEVSYHNFFPDNRALFERGYISAQLNNGLKSICTHLSSNVKLYLEYDLSHGSYEAQQSVEIGIMAETGDRVIMGDLNTGPRVIGQTDPEKNQDGEFVDNYESLISFGFKSPYASTDGRCTYCANNPLVEDYPNEILDHVMVKGDIVASDVERLYDNVSPVLSDHYGVGMNICKK